MDSTQTINNKLYLQVKSPEKTLFEGLVYSVSSINQKGAFDIYPDHENFISVVSQKLIISHLEAKNQQELSIESGIIKVLDNKVYIFIGL